MKQFSCYIHPERGDVMTGGALMTDKQFASELINRITENTMLREEALAEGAEKTAQKLQSIIDRDNLKLSIIKQGLDSEILK